MRFKLTCSLASTLPPIRVRVLDQV
jgi:hypothetical protein